LTPRDWRFRIRDILDAADRIRSYTSDLTRDEFSADSMLQEAVSTTSSSSARLLPRFPRTSSAATATSPGP